MPRRNKNPPRGEWMAQTKGRNSELSNGNSRESDFCVMSQKVKNSFDGWADIITLLIQLALFASPLLIPMMASLLHPSSSAKLLPGKKAFA